MNNFKQWLVASLVVLTTACSTSEEDKLKKPVDLPDFEQKVSVTKAWSKSVGEGGDRPFGFIQPVIYGQSLYVASTGGKVYKLDKADGNQRWKTDLDETLISGVAVGLGKVFVGLKTGELVALNENDGIEIWRQQLEGEVVAPVVAAKNRVFAQTSTGLLLGLNAEDGEEVWRNFNSMPTLTVRGTATPVAIDSTVITGLANGKLVAFDIDSGIPRWDARLAISSGDSEIERVADVDVQPLVIGQRVIAGSYNGTVAMVDGSSGQVYWQRETEIRGDVSEGFGNVYYANAQGEVLSYDAASAQIKWVNESLLRRGLGDTATWLNYVVAADYQGHLHILSQRDGSIVGRKRIGDDLPRAPFLVSEGLLYVLNNDGILSAYKATVSE